MGETRNGEDDGHVLGKEVLTSFYSVRVWCVGCIVALSGKVFGAVNGDLFTPELAAWCTFSSSSLWKIMAWTCVFVFGFILRKVTARKTDHMK